ncbi:MAG: hypothetical protein NTY19_23305 [Planctomycetota bacterium]|nr:hypothetical protein [Planctomycetota bacterium]
MPDELLPDPAEPTAVDELRSLVAQARAGDVSVLPLLRQTLDRHPQVWQHFGNLAGHAEQAWLKLLAGGDLCILESVSRKASELRSELAGPTPSPLERLLVDAVVVSWLEAEYYTMVLAAAREEGSPRQAESLQQRRTAAHRRHLAAIKTLAETRKLLSSPSPSARGSSKSRRRGGLSLHVDEETPPLSPHADASLSAEASGQ